MKRSFVAFVIAISLALSACADETPDPLKLVAEKLGGTEGAISVIVSHYQVRAAERGTHRWITDEGITAFGECVADFIRENLGRYEILLVGYDFSRDQDVLREWEKKRLRDKFIRFRERNPVIAKEIGIHRTTGLQKIHDEVLLLPCENRVKRHFPDLV